VRGRPFAPALSLLSFVLAIPASPADAADCQDWVARTVSTQGRVEARPAGESQWLPVRLGDTHCLGDAIRLGPLSRAAIVLRDGGVVRLDQNTTITFTPPAERVSTWIDLLTGAVHFFSRTPRGLRITTPFVNGTVEGTEFLVEVDPSESRISVWEGRVLAENAQGSLALTSGQSAVARAGQAPMLRPIVVRPTDAVAWALYYPPVLDLRPEDFPDRPGETWPPLIRRSIDEAGRGDLASALASVVSIPDTVTEPRVFTYRAGLLLAVGRVDEALADIDRALRLAPHLGEALALRSVVAVAKNDRAAAGALAEQAIQSDPGSAAAHLALSYARQAAFDLNGALASVQQAVQLQPGNALARARLAELWLSLGNLNRAQEAATEAARLDPGNARAQTVLGFTALTHIRRREAAEAFERAIQLDPAAPLPRLGLGLTRIRGGDLEGGRQELEIAVSLDPGDSLQRSYLGKAYYEERRPALAADQFTLAQKLDPNDPTPWLYDAIRLQSVNRPVEALESLQRSIELNDNRAVYRSQFLLEQDLATRGASLGRIYGDLGFEHIGLVEAWKSVNTDPTNHSAHLLLADSYIGLPRHEVAQVSEVLQAQLLQPLTGTPVPPFLALDNSFILAGTGPTTASLNEFNPLFERNRISVRATGLVGGNDTYGDELVASGLWDRLAVSLGQFHYETDGFRTNNDLKIDIYNVFAQVALSPSTSIQTEYRHTERKNGDLPLRFDPENFEPTLREDQRTDTFRLGLRQQLTPSSVLVGSFLYGHDEFDTEALGSSNTTKQDAYNPELQYFLQKRRFSLVGGAGYYRGDARNSTFGEIDRVFGNAYVYSHVRPLDNVTFTAGMSVDSLSSELDDSTQVNPKVGLVWNPFLLTTLRAAVFRTLRRPLVAGQSIEPTQVAGFNQLFDDASVGTDTWRYGAAVDQRLPGNLYVGGEFARRDMDLPFAGLDFETGTESIQRADWTEDLARAYAYWAPIARLALSVEYQYERLKRPPEFPGAAEVVESRTHRVPLGIAYFDPSGFTARLQAMYVTQDGRFGDFSQGVVSGKDQFWVVDASLSYRLPRRWGLITLEARNLLDADFRFNDTDSPNPTIYPERLILLRFTLAY
jgi:tetratricopeptide (TPR) repeat protein